MQFLKVSTAFTVIVGPILDASGVEYTSAVIGDLSISKNGTEAAMASAATLTHVSNGHYTLVGTTGNSDTLGRLDIRCNKSTYQMNPVRYEVLAAAAFDTLVTNGTLASTTSGRTIAVDSSGIADANVAKVNGSAVSAMSAQLGVNVVSMNNNVIDTGKISSGGLLEIAAAVLEQFADESGTAQAGASTTITLRSGAVATDSYYNGAVINIWGGTGAGQSRRITGYVGSTKVATVDSAWTTNPGVTSTYFIIGRIV